MGRIFNARQGAGSLARDRLGRRALVILLLAVAAWAVLWLLGLGLWSALHRP